jgi:hypothetical protein
VSTPAIEFPKAVGRQAKGLPRIASGTGAGIEATSMDKDENLPASPEQKRPMAGIITTVFVTIFVLLVFLLGVSMVHHRFFRGQRVHQNGSLGQ